MCLDLKLQKKIFTKKEKFLVFQAGNVARKKGKFLYHVRKTEKRKQEKKVSGRSRTHHVEIEISNVAHTTHYTQNTEHREEKYIYRILI